MAFFRKKVTPSQMAATIFKGYVLIVNSLFEEAKPFDRDAYRTEHGWDFDKQSMVEESAIVYAAVMATELSRRFPKKKKEILEEMRRLMVENRMNLIVSAMSEYQEVLQSASEQTHTSDGTGFSPNDPITRAARLAVSRTFQPGAADDPRRIQMFRNYLMPFHKYLVREIRKYRVV